jgi:phosphatidyl-myo-inositol dimannoside synthase
MPVIRTKARLLLPTRALERQILELAEKYGTDLVVLDPALPVGWLGPRLKAQGLRYAVVLHGAEVTVPGRLPAAKQVLSRVLRNADHVIAAGGYPLAEGEHAAGRLLAATVIPPGIDIERFTPVGPDTTPAKLRAELGLPESVPLIVSTSRLVPRKGRDVLIRAADLLREEFPGLCVAISGTGRDLDRLRKIAARHPEVDVRFLGRLSDDELADLYRAGDLFVMLCRNRWAGLEQEGFGIVFLEAAASGLAQVAGLSGGSHEAVLDGVTGVVVDRPNNVRSAADAIGALLRNPDQRAAMGTASRQRAVAECTYDLLAERLMKTLAELDAAHTGHRANSSARR